MNVTMEMLVNYCKQYGYIFQGSEFMEVYLILGIMVL